MKEYFEVLRQCPLFVHISDEDMIPMLGCLGGHVVSYAKKETILWEGEPARNIGIILAGAAQLVQMDYFGNRNIVANVGVSELFGESFACAGVEELPISIVAAEKSRILFLDCLKITHFCGNACAFHRQIIFNLLKVVAEKNLIFHRKIEVTSRRSTREKLMAYLMQQAKIQQNSCVEIPYDRQELADYLAVERSGLSAEISKLRREGILECRKNRFVLLQRESS